MTTTRCPHIGTTTDTETCFAYPSGSNACYRFGDSQVVELAHQSSFCLTGGFAACPVFRSDAPEKIIKTASQPAASRSPRWRLTFASLLLLLLLSASIYLALANSANPPGEKAEQSLTTTPPGGFLVFIDGTPVQIGAVGTSTPESLLAEGLEQLLNIFRTSTPTPFMPLPTGTPFTPPPTATTTSTATATLFWLPTSTLFVFPTPVFYTPTATATYLAVTFTPPPPFTYTPTATHPPTLPAATATNQPVPTAAPTATVPLVSVTPSLEPTAAPFVTPTPINSTLP